MHVLNMLDGAVCKFHHYLNLADLISRFLYEGVLILVLGCVFPVCYQTPIMETHPMEPAHYSAAQIQYFTLNVNLLPFIIF